MFENDLFFKDEYIKEEIVPSNPWKILIVDDDNDIHTVTKFALDSVKINDRALSFTSAYSAKEAIEILKKGEDFALIFLDVVMEHAHAGLEVINYIRKELKNSLIRVIIRTGEPGAAPERVIIDDYDINDYKEKTELNVTRLYTSVRTSLLQYEQLKKLYENQDHLKNIIDQKDKEINELTKKLGN